MTNTKPCPYDNASWLSKVTFWWITGLFRTGFRKTLDESDLYNVSQGDEANFLAQKLERCWRKEVHKLGDGKQVSLFRTVFRAFRLQWMLPGLLVFILECLKVAQPLFIGQVIQFFYPDPPLPAYYAYIFAACLCLSNLMQVFINAVYFYNMHHLAMKMRIAISGLVYRKVLSLSCQSFYKTTSGQIVNFLSTDVEILDQTMDCIHYIWVSPCIIIVTMYLIYREIGLACFFALIPVASVMPIQFYLSHLFGFLRLKTAGWADKRIHAMTEIINGMRVIKMFCWEKPFHKLITQLRRHEMVFIKRSYIIKAVNLAFMFNITRIMGIFIFLGNWLFLSHPVTTRAVFVTLGLLDLLRFSAFFFITYAAENIAQLRASLKRIQTFLLLDEEKDLHLGGTLHKKVSHKNTESAYAVEIDYMTARWEMTGTEHRKYSKKKKKDSGSETRRLLHESEMEQYFSLKAIPLNIKKGELLAVVGAVGSGKTSLLLALLGEFPYQQGQITLHGTLGYAAQQSWVFSGTVKDNILFGDEYDFKKYSAVVDACALNKDLELMPNSDETLVGERGLFLSGGQKARLTLARAVYRDCDIYLLDDPLSAVDTKVGRHIFQKCIKLLLEEKTVVLVTHQLQYLRRADRILVLREGSVYDIGTYDELEERGVDITSFLCTEEKRSKDEINSPLEIETKEFKIQVMNRQENKEEVSESGAVGFSVYWTYIKAGFGIVLGPVVLLLGLGFQGSLSTSDWMLARWSESLDSRYWNVTNVTSPFFETPKIWGIMDESLKLYIIFVCVYVALIILCSISMFMLCAIASQNLHNQMFKFVLGARSRFFDTNPAGRILNRFSRDLGFMDNQLNRAIYATIVTTFGVAGSILVVCIIAPWLFIAVCPVIIIVIFIRYYALQTTREIKRLEATVRGPLYSHISDSVLGLQTIRALNKSNQAVEEFETCLNTHSSAWFMYITAFRWFSFRSVLFIVLFFVIVVYVTLALRETVASGLLGLALVYCGAVMEPFEFLMRISAEMENYMTCVERILSYTNLRQEGPMTSDRPPPDTWPMQGSVTFSDTCLKYDPSLPYALKHVSFHIKSKEKIGVVGRTGAGKSSLVAALLRMAEPEGKIWIDGVDTTIIGLTELRKKISVIPQDPVLFTGTLRKNLDPFQTYTDEDLWRALEAVQLKSKVKENNQGLFMDVAESGNNFSVGQRQLICLARALLEANRIVVLDEATAHVDFETDQLIQRVLRAKFRECTVLTIAHRLNTVMDCDRIMVLDEGELKEFDVPFQLLQQKGGYFFKLVEQLGRHQSKHLHALAELACHQRASASMLLEEAVKTATEIYRSSREDVRLSKESLLRSKESLEHDETTQNTIENSKTLYGRYSTPVKDSPKMHRKVRHAQTLPTRESPKVHKRTPSAPPKSNASDSVNGDELAPLVIKAEHVPCPTVLDERGRRMSPIKRPTDSPLKNSPSLSPQDKSGKSPRIISGVYMKPNAADNNSEEEKIVFC